MDRVAWGESYFFSHCLSSKRVILQVTFSNCFFKVMLYIFFPKDMNTLPSGCQQPLAGINGSPPHSGLQTWASGTFTVLTQITETTCYKPVQDFTLFIGSDFA